MIRWASTGVPQDIELLNNLKVVFTVSADPGGAALLPPAAPSCRAAPTAAFQVPRVPPRAAEPPPSPPARVPPASSQTPALAPGRAGRCLSGSPPGAGGLGVPRPPARPSPLGTR